MNPSERASTVVKQVVDAMVSKYKIAEVTITFSGDSGCDDTDTPIKWAIDVKVYFEGGQPTLPCGCELDIPDDPRGSAN